MFFVTFLAATNQKSRTDLPRIIIRESKCMDLESHFTKNEEYKRKKRRNYHTTKKQVVYMGVIGLHLPRDYKVNGSKDKNKSATKVHSPPRKRLEREKMKQVIP